MSNKNATTATASPMPDNGVVRRFFEVVKEGRENAVGDYIRNFPALLDHAGSPTGGTAIVTAAEAGHLPVVELLAKAGANIFASDNGDQSALFYAGHKGHPDIATFLINRGADPLQKNRSGISPIDIARASEMPQSFLDQMQRERGDYVVRITREAAAVQAQAVAEMKENVDQVTRIVGSGLTVDTAAPAKADFRKIKGRAPF